MGGMGDTNSISRRALAALLVTTPCLAARPANAQAPPAKSRTNLIAILRESMGGANKPDEALQPVGKIKMDLPDGKQLEVEPAWFSFIGDMHIRFGFDSPNAILNASTDELAQLQLTVEQALDLATLNLKRTYGAPRLVPWNGGIVSLEGRSPDLNSSYFLDREFWRNLLRTNPEGIVVSVPKRGGLLFTPVKQTEAVERLRRSVAELHVSSGRLRVSSALYLFKDDRWTVYQAPGVP
jgi:hypothetical protein